MSKLQVIPKWDLRSQSKPKLSPSAIISRWDKAPVVEEPEKVIGVDLNGVFKASQSAILLMIKMAAAPA